jgi:hypothetical protein
MEQSKNIARGQSRKIPAPCCKVLSMKGNGVVREPTNENSSTEDAMSEEGTNIPCSKKRIAQKKIKKYGGSSFLDESLS